LRSGWSEDRAATVYSGAVVLGFVAAVLGPSLIGLRTLISVNTLSAYFPWRASGLETLGHERCTGDTIDTVMPSIAFVREQWLHGHLGAWQGLVGGGSPLGALPSTGLLDPLSLPYLVLPLWLAPAFVKLLELAVGGGGTYLFLRRLGVPRPAGMLAGLVFGTSGFMVMWSNWPQTRVAALIPPLFWAVERLAQRLRLIDVALVAAVVASLLLGGFPAVTEWALELAGLYFLVRLAASYRHDVARAMRGVGMGILGVGVGVVLAMIQLLPFIDTYKQMDAEARNTYGLTPLLATRLITLISPGSYGLCIAGEPKYDGGSPVENVAYIGAAALLLALVGACVRRRIARPDGSTDRGGGRGSALGVTSFFAAAAAAIIVIGWTSRGVLRELQPIPPFSGNPVGRIRSVLGFTLAVLAGFGFDAITRRRQRTGDRRSWRPSTGWIRPAVIVGAFTVTGVVILYRVRVDAVNHGFWPNLKPTLYVPALLVLATLVVLACAATGRRWGRWLAIFAVPLLVVGQGAFFFHRVLPGDDPHNFYPRTGAHQFLQSHVGDQRFDATGQVMYPATSLYYGLRAATGHAFQTSQWTDLLHAADAESSLTPTFTAFSNAMTPSAVGSSRILDRLGVSYWVFNPGDINGAAAPLPATGGAVPVPGGGSVSCRVPGGALRGVTIRLAAPLHLLSPLRPATIAVTAHNGAQAVSSSRAVVGDLPAGSTFAIGVPGEQFGPGATSIALTVTGAAAPVVLQGSAAAAACAPISPAADHLRLVYAGAGALIYQRLDALARIRWSGNAEVITNPATRIKALIAGVPDDTVVLDAPAGTASGRSASVSVQHDDPGRIQVRVQAEGSGYVTVSDALTTSGWLATVDGKPTPLLVGDHALGAVAVPAGVHTVAFLYRAPGFAAGRVLSVLGLLAVIGLLVGDRLLRRRRREPSVTEGRLSAVAEVAEPAVEPSMMSRAPEPEHEPPT
jgi:hypothetical protein